MFGNSLSYRVYTNVLLNNAYIQETMWWWSSKHSGPKQNDLKVNVQTQIVFNNMQMQCFLLVLTGFIFTFSCLWILKKCPAALLHFSHFPLIKAVWWFASSTDISFGLIYHMVEVIIPGLIGFFNYQNWWHKYQRNGKINKMSGRACTM